MLDRCPCSEVMKQLNRGLVAVGLLSGAHEVATAETSARVRTAVKVLLAWRLPNTAVKASEARTVKEAAIGVAAGLPADIIAARVAGHASRVVAGTVVRYAATAAGIGSIVPVFGTATGFIVGVVVGAAVSYYAGNYIAGKVEGLLIREDGSEEVVDVEVIVS